MSKLPSKHDPPHLPLRERLRIAENNYELTARQFAEHRQALALVLNSTRPDDPSELVEEVRRLTEELAARTEQLDPESIQHWDAMREERDLLRRGIEEVKQQRDELRDGSAAEMVERELGALADEYKAGRDEALALLERCKAQLKAAERGRCTAMAFSQAELAELERARDAAGQPAARTIFAFVRWLSEQHCTHDAEHASADCDCSETDACITEWCWPCQARAHVTGLDGRATASPRRRAEADEDFEPVPEWLAALRRNLATQDNAATKHPLFIVQQRRRIYGVDTGYTDDCVWMDEDWNEQPDPDDEDNPPDGWTRVGYLDQWEFVTACFTGHGCKAYIEANGHNLCEPRIYVESAHRNREWQRVREWLATAQPEAAERLRERVEVVEECYEKAAEELERGANNADYQASKAARRQDRENSYAWECVAEQLRAAVARVRALGAEMKDAVAEPPERKSEQG